VGCIFPIIVVSLLLHAELNGHQKDAACKRAPFHKKTQIDPESGEVIFVPNYEKLAKSKFDGKYNKGGNGRERNKNRVR